MHRSATTANRSGTNLTLHANGSSSGGVSRSNTAFSGGQQQQQQQQQRPQYQNDDRGRGGTTQSNTSNGAEPGVYGEEVVQREVDRVFPEIQDQDFCSVELALQLLDKSSLGRSQTEFNRVADRLEQVVDTIVSAHHRDLNTNIDAYSATLEGLASAQAKIREIKQQLLDSRDLLRLKRADLVQTFIRLRQYQEMVGILDAVEELRKVPETVERYKKCKAYPEAVTCLYKACMQVEAKEFADLGALAELRRYFANAYTTIHESIINDMQTHLFKSALAQTGAEDEEEDASGTGGGGSSTTGGEMRFFRWQPEHATRGDGDDTDDVLGNGFDPESDSAGFVDLLLGSLSRLGKMEEALEMIQQRTPAELRRVVDRAFEIAERKNHEPVLFLRALCSRFGRVLESYRLVYEKVAMVLELEEPAVARRIEEINVQTFKEAWISMQGEIKNVFYDYLTEDQRSPAAFSNPVASLPDVMKSSKKARDRRKKLFRLAEPAYASKSTMGGSTSAGSGVGSGDKGKEDGTATMYASVYSRLERALPPLVVKQVREATQDPTSETAARITMLTAGTDPYASGSGSGVAGGAFRRGGTGSTDNAGSMGRLLAKPGPITVAPLFRVTLEFTARARRSSRLVEGRELVAFLEDYWQMFFLPIAPQALAREMGGSTGLRDLVKELAVGIDEEEAAAAAAAGLGVDEDDKNDSDDDDD